MLEDNGGMFLKYYGNIIYSLVFGWSMRLEYRVL